MSDVIVSNKFYSNESRSRQNAKINFSYVVVSRAKSSSNTLETTVRLRPYRYFRVLKRLSFKRAPFSGILVSPLNPHVF